jgi:hypothetical protein
VKTVIVLIFISSQAFGQSADSINSLRRHGVPPQCRAIVQSCKRALVLNKTAKPLDNIVDCLIPLTHGKKIKGIKVPPAVQKSCNDGVQFLIESDKHRLPIPRH